MHRHEPRSTEEKTRRALIAGLWLRDESEEDASPLDEIARLAAGLNLEIVARCEQQLPRRRRGTVWGRGKVEEMKELLAEHEADVLVCNVDLSAGCRRSLSAFLEARVMDRTELILEVFARRAHTEEGRLQVEMARRSYHLARMLREGKELDRQGGGIGARGPGESAAHLARRRIHRRKVELGRKLRREGRKRARRRERRRAGGAPQIALVGYTNAGKSSLLNALVGRVEARAADRLFETLDTTTRRLRLRDGPVCVLSDTVGFIRGLPHHLVEAFEATLAEAVESRLLVEVADGASPLLESHRRTVRTVLERIGAGDLPRLLVLNKADLVDEEALAALRGTHPEAIVVSTRSRQGLDELQERIVEKLATATQRVTLRVPHDELGALAPLYEHHQVVERRDEEEGVFLRVRLAPEALARFAPWIIEEGEEP